MEIFTIRNQTHTLACLIRHSLFDNEASFASCTVPHPLDTDLLIKIKSKNNKECLLAALNERETEIKDIMSGSLMYREIRDLPVVPKLD
jgi:DNA-directed RNA polymerase subunit L